MIEIAVYEVHQAIYTVSTDPARLDVAVIHGFLTHAYWSPGITYAAVAQALAHSLCFGLYAGQQQIGLARVVTDYTSFAYLCDVFVLPPYRGEGLGVWLMACVVEHPALKMMRTFLLATRDAHELYQKFGFTLLANPDRWMAIRYQQPWYDPAQVEE
jgi:GNAT superfamily N-acetyltransferase